MDWEIIRQHFESCDSTATIGEGWKPFAASEEYIWLRRLKPEKAIGDNPINVDMLKRTVKDLEGTISEQRKKIHSLVSDRSQLKDQLKGRCVEPRVIYAIRNEQWPGLLSVNGFQGFASEEKAKEACPDGWNIMKIHILRDG